MTSKEQQKATITTPTDTEIVTERVFDAPRELVFKAFTEADLVAQWWGRESSKTVVEELDLRAGGAWRFVEETPDDSGIAFFGTFREVVSPEKLVMTFGWEGMPGHEMVETMTLEDLGERTKVKTVSVFSDKADRDGMIDAPMEVGLNESYAALDGLLESLQSR